MKLLLLFFALILTLTTSCVSAQCTVSLSSTDTLICSGDTISLNAAALGPANQLNASSSAGNNHRGNMFDIVAANTVTILSFDASPMGNTTIEIYYKTGTWNGFANTPSAWTLIGSAPVTASGGIVPVPVPVNITIPAGQTYAFYVTSNTTAVSLNYSDGTGVGNVYTSDANITFLEGGGMEYPFTGGTGAVYQPRVWNGAIHYALADIPGTTYFWSTAETTETIEQSPTASTQYVVESTVPGCPSTAYDTLDVVVSLPTVEAGSDQAVCYGSSVMLTGSGTESYDWNNSVTDSVAFIPTATMDYVVTGIDTIGCTDIDSLTVTVYDLPAVSAGDDFAVCIGEAAMLSGQGAADYAWSNSISDAVAFVPSETDSYIVTGTDLNNCVNYDTVTVTVNPLPSVSAGPDQIVCAGEQSTLQGSGAESYEWNNGVIDGVPFTAANGTYTVIGTDANGCSDSDEMSITLGSITAPIGLTGGILTTTVMNGVTNQWIDCADMTPIDGETEPVFSPTVTGSYAVILTNNLGCSDTSDCVLVDFAAIEEQLEAELSVFPVPANDKITVSSTGALIERVELIDLLGNVLEAAEPNAAETTIDLSAYAANTYVVRVFRGDRVELLKVTRY